MSNIEHERLLGDPLFVLSVEGLEVENELSSSPVIRTILDGARQAAEKAIETWLTTDPFDGKTIQALQNEVIRQRELVTWIKDKIAEGLNAEEQMRDQDEG